MRVLVTGGGGFLGKAIAGLLVEKGFDVISYSRNEYPELKKLGVKHLKGDLNNITALTDAMEGCDSVFHVAAKAGIWGPYEEFYNANVTGTENVLIACRKLGIKKLVYTSTPSVVFSDGGIEGGDESLPYPDKCDSHYQKTKTIAEKMVLKANNQNLSTVSLRPHLIWGPGDHHFLPRLVSKARAGKLRIIGNAPNLVDSVYIDNAALAHLQAFEKLYPGSPVAGKAYFITQGEPLPIADLINKILKAANAPLVTKKIPFKLANIAGSVFEFVYTVLDIKTEPPLTKFVVKQLSTPHWFNISSAKKDFGYTPVISTEEGMNRLSEWLTLNPEIIKNL